MKVHSVSSYKEMETILNNKGFQNIFYLNTLKSMVICAYNIPDDLLKSKQESLLEKKNNLFIFIYLF